MSDNTLSSSAFRFRSAAAFVQNPLLGRPRSEEIFRGRESAVPTRLKRETAPCILQQTALFLLIQF